MVFSCLIMITCQTNVPPVNTIIAGLPDDYGNGEYYGYATNIRNYPKHTSLYKNKAVVSR